MLYLYRSASATDHQSSVSVSDETASAEVASAAASTTASKLSAVDDHVPEVVSEIVTDITPSDEQRVTMVIHNETPSHAAMMSHVMRYRCLQPRTVNYVNDDVQVKDDDDDDDEEVNVEKSIEDEEGQDEVNDLWRDLNVDAILSAVPCRPPKPAARRGPKEALSEWLIAAASNGQLDDIEGVLDDQRVSPDVADSAGQTPLLVASVCRRRGSLY